MGADVDADIAAPNRAAPAAKPWQGERAALVRSSSASLLGSAIVGVSQVAVLLVLARLSTQEATGTFAALTSVFLLSQAVARLGIPTTLVFFVSRAREPGLAQQVRRLTRLGSGPVLVASAIIALVVVVLGTSVLTLVGVESARTDIPLAPMMIMLPAAAVLDCLLGSTQGMRQIRPTVLADQVIRPVLQLLLVTVVVVAGQPYLAATAWAIPYLPAAVLAGIWLVRAVGPKSGSPKPSTDLGQHVEVAEFWRYAMPRWGAGIVQMGLQRVDIILVAALSGITAAAVYTAATRFVVIGQTIQLSIGRVVSPRLSGALASGDTTRARMLYATTTTWLVLMVWPVFLGMALLAEPLMATFGPGYSEGVAVVWILAAAMLLATGVGLADTVLIMGGRSSLGLMNQVAALAVMLLVDVALIPEYGVVGAAIGWAAGLTVRSLLPLTQNKKLLGVDPFARSTALACLSAFVSFGVVGWAVLLTVSGPWQYVVAAGTATLTYLGCVYALRHWLELDLALLKRKGRR